MQAQNFKQMTSCVYFMRAVRYAIWVAESALAMWCARGTQCGISNDFFGRTPDGEAFGVLFTSLSARGLVFKNPPDA